MFCKITFLSIIHDHNSGTEGEIATIFHTELVTLILVAHLETAVMAGIIFAAVSKIHQPRAFWGFADIELSVIVVVSYEKDLYQPSVKK